MSIQINLLPWREELKETKKKEFYVLLAGASIFSVFMIMLVHMSMVGQITFQVENNNILKQEISVLDMKIAEIKALKKEKEQLLARMQIIQQLQTNRPHIVRLFDGVTRTIPEGLYLTGITRNQTKILIDGKAESNTRVSTFMRNIENYSWLKNPNLSLIQADEKKENNKYIGFNLEAIQVIEELNKHHESQSE